MLGCFRVSLSDLVCLVLSPRGVKKQIQCLVDTQFDKFKFKFKFLLIQNNLNFRDKIKTYTNFQPPF